MDHMEPQIVQLEYSDFDELTDAIKGWELEFQKLDAGAFRATTRQWASHDFILAHASANCSLRQCGEPPPGLRTFVVPGRAEVNMIWRSKRVTGNDLMVFPVGGELNALCPPGFDVFSLSISEDALVGLIDMRKFQNLETLSCNPATIAKFRRLLRQAILAEGDFHVVKALIIRELAFCANEALQVGTIKREHQPFKVQSIAKAAELILSHPEEPATVQGICDSIGVCRRTLEYAFIRHVGVRPKSFINAIRLNAVRKQLRAPSAGLRVADAANAFGFWHMGQFAADYRKLFGELPSQTLSSNWTSRSPP